MNRFATDTHSIQLQGGLSLLVCVASNFHLSSFKEVSLRVKTRRRYCYITESKPCNWMDRSAAEDVACRYVQRM